MGKVYNTVEDFLSVCFEVTTNQPLDTRESVKTFDALLDKDSFGAVYETMKVLVQDEDCIYVLVSLPDAEEKNRWGNIGRQFVKKKDETDLSPNKKLWKRLTIEIITEWSALKRAMDNLVNGALIYLANDIAELNASNQPTSTVHKAGLYFCENVNGTGKLTLAGGGGDTHAVHHGTLKKDEKGDIVFEVNDLSFHAGYVADSIESEEAAYYISMIGEDNLLYVYTPDYIYDVGVEGAEKGSICTINNTFQVEGKLKKAVEALNNRLTRVEESIAEINKAIQSGLENMTIDFGQYEDSVSVVIMDPSTITRARMRNVKKLLISYGETMQQEYTEGTTINLGNADFIVLDITRTEEGQNATVGLTLKKNN